MAVSRLPSTSRPFRHLAKNSLKDIGFQWKERIDKLLRAGLTLRDICLKKRTGMNSPSTPPISISDDRCWKLRPDVVATVLNDGAVLLDLQSNFFFSPNSS